MTRSQSQDEERLLRMAAQGDREAFADLYRKYLDSLYKFVYLFTRSVGTAEEIVQEVFIRIWERHELLSEVQSFRSYLFRAAKNRMLNYIRHRRVEERTLAGYLAEKKLLLKHREMLSIIKPTTSLCSKPLNNYLPGDSSYSG